MSKAQGTLAEICSTDVFEDELRSASDVCWNCFSLIHREAETPSRSYLENRHFWHGGNRPDDVHTPRGGKALTDNAEIGYPPQNNAASPGELFCQCGTSGAWTRNRHAWVSEERLRVLVMNAVETLREKGQSIDESVAYERALSKAREGFTWPSHSADDAVKYGIKSALRNE